MDSYSSSKDAKRLVKRIAKDHGYLGEDILQRIEPEVRREIEEAFLKKDLMIGNSVITLAKNLYTNKARFVFELLQNADDNCYSKAGVAGSVPYISFHVHPHKIVIDCNEDGFTPANLEAICSVGKSSKLVTGARGYIGEKGIGFKSVFMAAWKVHIQSGAFSFSFTHKNGDSGMGMISPVWEDSRDRLVPPLTRITLYLHETGDADVLANVRKTIREQFQELQEAILLFMKNLRRIDIEFFGKNGRRTSSTTYSIERPRENHAILWKAIGGAESRAKDFHITTHEATGLARNENRTYSSFENAIRAYSKSQVVLAFPLSHAAVPIIEPQELFAFLPVRPVGFNFIIHADFVTDANRQDIVEDSPRNNGLLDGIADAFARAALQFCDHATLRYQWIRYLPQREGKSLGTLWDALVNRIAERLEVTPVLYGYKQPGVAYRISNLRRLLPYQLDEDGQPLFDDVGPKHIISQSYDRDGLDVLSDYGLKDFSYQDIIKWLKQDLRRGTQSRMKSAETSDSWHARAANMLCAVFERCSPERRETMKELDLLPLGDGTWASASSGPVYYPQFNGIDIPSDIGLRLLSRNALSEQRKILFQKLGVTDASAKRVREKILERYPKGEVPTNISLSESKHHLEFLYLTKHLVKHTKPHIHVHVFTSQGALCRPHPDGAYIANDDPYGPWELCRTTAPGPNLGDGAPGYSVKFLNKTYFEDPPAQPNGQDRTWVEWFYDMLLIDKNFPLAISPIILKTVGKYLLEHRPEKFLGAVRVSHNHQEIFCDTWEEIREAEVMCRGGRQRVPLYDAYFPVVELERRVERLVEPGAFFPWLWLDTKTPSYDAIPPEWKEMLDELKVGSPSTDVAFALDMLQFSAKAIPDKITTASKVRLFQLYEHIQAKCREAPDRVAAIEEIREAFEDRYIYIPHGKDSCKWALPEECVWDAPVDMKTKYALQRLYQPCFGMGDVDSSYLTAFFTNTLNITDCTWQIYVEELKALKASGCDESDCMTAIYKALDGLRHAVTSTDRDALKQAFETDALIYVPSEVCDESAWHKVSQCVWSSAARLRGRISLNDDYDELKELFVDFLGVKPVDLSMAIDELVEAARRTSTTISEMKDSIWTVNALLFANTKRPRVRDAMLKAAIFPIRYPKGAIARKPKTTEFFVVDREPLRRSFEKKVKFLDFSLEEVVKLAPFLKWVSLEDKYLSSCVRAFTSFPGEGAMPTSRPDRQVRNRAYALLRIASHFNSPRTRSKQQTESFYEVLRNAQICETDGISSGLQLLQDGTTHMADGRRTTLHIDDNQTDGTGLKIYVPRDQDDQEYTFTSSLPERLFDWMMKDPRTQISEGTSKDGVSATRDVLLAPRSRITLALEDNGIATVDIADIDMDDGSKEEETALAREPEALPSTPPRFIFRGKGSAGSTPNGNEEDHFNHESSPVFFTPATSVGAASPATGSRNDSTSALSRMNLNVTPSRPPRQLSSSTDPFLNPVLSVSPAASPDNSKYIALLGKVIAAAKRTNFPGCGPFGMGELATSLPAIFGDTMGNGTDFGLRSLTQIERDRKVGAAGELYVFELLSSLWLSKKLADFSRTNWQCTIRNYVTAHPQYADMGPWTGRETSDIVYFDRLGQLTNLLVEKGYLDQTRWGGGGRQPTYFIEVKTTTLSCETPFYMSKAQYQRMRDSAISEHNKDNIYILFRVFNLGRDDMGVRIYVDPEKLRLDKKLHFTAETWSVVPS